MNKSFPTSLFQVEKHNQIIVYKLRIKGCQLNGGTLL
jgi:hypothetical protein